MSEDSDAGWLKGLPSGWIDGFVCGRRLFERLKSEYATDDPAPWHEVINPDYWGPQLGKTSAEHVLYQKLVARLVATFQRAIFAGTVSPSWFNGSEFKRIPAHAFGERSITERALSYGELEVDPMWPDEWQAWSGHGWAIHKEQFEFWIETGESVRTLGLPMKASEIPPCDIVPISSRKPSDASRVSLSEAVTWLAYGVALDAERFGRAIHWERLAGGDLQAAQGKLEAAATMLLRAAADGLISMYGRHVQTIGEKGAKTEPINPLALEDYRKVQIGHDTLHYGTGLFVWYRRLNDSVVHGSERQDHYANVTVDRESLIRNLGSPSDSMGAMLAQNPATLPGIGLVMGLDEALCWLAYGRPSYDLQLWTDGAGDISIRDPSGAPLPNSIDGDPPPHLVAYMRASRRLWTSLQDGTLRGLVAPADGPALTVPRVYWNGINPEHLEYSYGGLSSTDAGRGRPILLARQAFDEWKAAAAASKESGGNVPRNRQLDHDQIVKRATELRKERADISKGSAAASIIAELGENPRTGKPWDNRHIERIIGRLWPRGDYVSPPPRPHSPSP
jgi:hypothetical protein